MMIILSLQSSKIMIILAKNEFKLALKATKKENDVAKIPVPKQH